MWLDSPGQLGAAGFLDSWLQRDGPRMGTGFTCCQNADLRKPSSLLFKRIDLVMVRPDRHTRGCHVAPMPVGRRMPIGIARMPAGNCGAKH